MWEIGSRGDKEDGVAIYKTRGGGDADLIRWCWAVDEVDFDIEVLAGFTEGGVGGLWYDPANRLESRLKCRGRHTFQAL